MKHCPQCNLDFPQHFRFCGACGGPLNDSRRCPGCGELNETKWPFCTHCGSKLSPDAPQTLTMPPSEPPSQPVASTPTQERKAPGTPTEQPSRETTIRYSEPGELYAADQYRERTSVDTRAPDWSDDGDESVTAEIPRDPDKHYAIASTSAEAAPVVNRDSSRNDQIPLQVTVASPSEMPRPAPTLSMMESYGRESEAPSQLRWWHGAIVVLIILLFAGGGGLGGWYWWSHRTAAAQPPVATPTPNEGNLSQEPSPSPSAKPTSSNQLATVGSADEELKLLRDRRAKAQPSEANQIVAATIEAEKKHPNDYRFPYERAKLSITGVTSHHEAFRALALAAEKAIDNSKAQEMLNNLNTDSAADFYKLSRGHREWHIIQDALRSQNKAALKDLPH